MNRTTITLVLVAGAMFVAGLLVGTRESVQATLLLSGPEEAPTSIDLDPVWKAWRLLEERYVPATTTDPLSDQDRVWGMIEGLASAYGDPYTVFMPPRESKSFEEEISGSFGGVGIEIGMRDKILTVIAPLKGTPGEKAGLRAGDRIVEIDGVSTYEMSIDESIERIRGEVGTDVVFKIAREGESDFLTIAVTRDTIEIPTIDTEMHDDGIFVISLYNFGGTALDETRRALREFYTSRADKLVLDLRGNPGGYLDIAIEIASYFLPIGTPVVLEDRGQGDMLIHRSKGYNVIGKDVEVVVLIDQGSASASEIVAGALRDHDRATLIGQQTFGKGSVQELIDVTPETSIKITVARWLTPNGTSLSLGGLLPDHEVELSREDIEAERDPQLDVAFEYLKTGVLPTPAPAETEEAE